MNLGGGAGTPATPYRRLLLLALVVLAIHLWLLLQSPSRLVSQPAAPVQRFLLREVAAAPAPAAITMPPAPTPAPAARRPPDSPQRSQVPAAATPVPTAAPAAEPAGPPPAEPPALAGTAEPQSRPATASGMETGMETGIDSASASTSASASAPAAPAASGQTWRATVLPEPARIHYEVLVQASGITVQGQAELHWRHDGRRYDARMAVTGLLLPRREQRSTGRIGPDGLEPLRFSDHGRRGEQATHFVRDQGKVVFSNNQPEAVLEAGAQDRLSVVVQLSMIVAGEPQKYPAGTAIAIPTAGTGDSETWVFTVEGEEELQLPGGTLQTLKLQRQPRKEYDQKVELWLAPRMDYAPVRVRLTNPNGDSVDQRWSSTDKG